MAAPPSILLFTNYDAIHSPFDRDARHTGADKILVYGLHILCRMKRDVSFFFADEFPMMRNLAGKNASTANVSWL